MRKARVAAAAAILAAGLTGGIASSAGADPPENFGHCVSRGLIDPSAGGPFGPANTNAHLPSGGANAAVNSNEHSRFHDGFACSP